MNAIEVQCLSKTFVNGRKALDNLDLTKLPEYWELVVTGTAWREEQNEKTIRECDLCGRTQFPEPNNLRVDESRWDGSDFFHVNMNKNIVIVTQRVCDALEELGASNYDCRLIT